VCAKKLFKKLVREAASRGKRGFDARNQGEYALEPRDYGECKGRCARGIGKNTLWAESPTTIPLKGFFVARAHRERTESRIHPKRALKNSIWQETNQGKEASSRGKQGKQVWSQDRLAQRFTANVGG